MLTIHHTTTNLSSSKICSPFDSVTNFDRTASFLIFKYAGSLYLKDTSYQISYQQKYFASDFICEMVPEWFVHLPLDRNHTGPLRRIVYNLGCLRVRSRVNILPAIK